ncbi:nitroreductase family protein [Burkholderia sp. TSV86]|uniref:nitroreductase family protein n=1 Tax=Burkholderia sp. TSV86 TaxID=1385594 RepID=UPI0018D21A10|nr:nitroreductase [Burkholderia sp. TSV86]
MQTKSHEADSLMTDFLAPLLKRRSTPIRQLGGSVPDPATLNRLLEAAIRVPDHGKLEPFRLILLEGEAKLDFGERLVERALRREPGLSAAQQEKERLRYTFAPLVIAVIARIDPAHKVPALEQQLSAGCVAYNLLLGASQIGLGAQWLTGWAAYDPEVAALLGLLPNEQVIGFVHLGHARGELPERSRPELGKLVSRWKPAAVTA